MSAFFAGLRGNDACFAMLSAIGKLRVGGGGDPYLCKRPIEYSLAKGVLCGNLDLVTPLEREFQGDPCNAGSLVVQFSGYRAQLGTARYESPSITGGSCAGFTDSCGVGGGADGGN